jgi:hydroxypyruvate isomerase
VVAAEKLGCPRLNLHGTGLDGRDLPVRPVHETGARVRLEEVEQS